MILVVFRPLFLVVCFLSRDIQDSKEMDYILVWMFCDSGVSLVIVTSKQHVPNENFKWVHKSQLSKFKLQKIMYLFIFFFGGGGGGGGQNI